MWVRLYEWMIMDGEPALPDIGDALARVGIRVRGVPREADPNSHNGVVVADGKGNADPQRTEYRLTGVAGEARDVEAARPAGGSGRSLAEFVLAVDSDRFHVQFEGRARSISPGSRVTVSGKLALVGEYEWDAFRLSDTRDDWLVEAVVAAGSGDAMLDLVRPANR